MAYYLCMLDCLCQKHEYDSLGRRVELVNLRAQQGKVYEHSYDLTEYNVEGREFFKEVPGPVRPDMLVRPRTDIPKLEPKVPERPKKSRKASEG
jgi:hypothetical protein